MKTSKNGYQDLRYEFNSGERFYIDNKQINRHLAIHRSGLFSRVAGENKFLCSSKFESTNLSSNVFSDFIREKTIAPNQSVKIDDEILNPIKVSDEIVQEVIKLSNKELSFRFTYERKNVFFQNSMGHKIYRKDQDEILRIDYRTMVNDLPLHLRSFVHHPTTERVHQSVARLKETKNELSIAQSSDVGTHRVLLHPSVASVFAHEIFGHVSERIHRKQNIEEAKRMFEGVDVKVVDSVSDKDILVKRDFDDEGVVPKDVDIINQGSFVEPLVNLENAFMLGMEPNGRGRAQDFRFAPLCRMNNIKICEGKDSLDELFLKIGDGYYFIGSLGGLLSDSFFQIQTQYGYKITNGVIDYPVTGGLLMGTLGKSLKSIVGVGDHCQWITDGGCLGANQFLELSGRGSPHVALGHIQIL